MVSELDADVRVLMHETHRFIGHTPEAIALDMVSRERVQGVDLYISSCPCQDYSLAGKQQGLRDISQILARCSYDCPTL